MKRIVFLFTLLMAMSAHAEVVEPKVAWDDNTHSAAVGDTIDVVLTIADLVGVKAGLAFWHIEFDTTEVQLVSWEAGADTIFGTISKLNDVMSGTDRRVRFRYHFTNMAIQPACEVSTMINWDWLLESDAELVKVRFRVQATGNHVVSWYSELDCCGGPPRGQSVRTQLLPGPGPPPGCGECTNVIMQWDYPILHETCHQYMSEKPELYITGTSGGGGGGGGGELDKAALDDRTWSEIKELYKNK